MNEGLIKTKELLLSNEEFRGKLKAAFEAYKGEQTEEALFNEVLVPLTAEYGVSVTYDEYKEFFKSGSDDDREVGLEELAQLTGGDKNMKGFGGAACIGCGLGLGGGGGDGKAFGCLVVGGGGVAAGCAGNGASETLADRD